MKKSTLCNLSFIALLLVMITGTSFSQNVSCENLMRAVKSEASYYGEVSSFTLISSEFLKEVKAYDYEGTLFVIATFQPKSNEFFPRTYIFCGIPYSNWNSFKNGFNGSYGERFHQYIIDYVCNCN
jgi:hypothetical protein